MTIFSSNQHLIKKIDQEIRSFSIRISKYQIIYVLFNGNFAKKIINIKPVLTI